MSRALDQPGVYDFRMTLRLRMRCTPGASQGACYAAAMDCDTSTTIRGKTV